MPHRKMSSAFARGSPAHNFIKSKLLRGDIRSTDKPKKVRNNCRVELMSMGVGPEASQNSFRAIFYRAKEEVMTEKEDEHPEEIAEDLTDLDNNRMGSFTPSKRLRMQDYVNERVDSDEEENVNNAAVIPDLLTPPLYRVEKWKEPLTLTERVTVYLTLFAGATSDDFEIEISEDGMSLELVLYWPKPMIDLNMMLRKALRDSTENESIAAEVHAEIQAFSEGLKRFRANRSERISTRCVILLPIRVQKEVVSQSWIQFSDTSFQGLLIRLKGIDVTYGIVKPELELELV